MTQHSTLSHETKVVIQNPGLSYDEWFYADQNQERRRDVSLQLGFLTLIILMFVLAFFIEQLSFLPLLGSIVGLTVLGFSAIPFFARRVASYCGKKQATYRDRRADDLRSSLAASGFTVIPDEGKTALQTLMTNNYPNLQDSNGKTYTLGYMLWEDRELTLYLNTAKPKNQTKGEPLDDGESEDDNPDSNSTVAQERIEDIVQEYEATHGVMTGEKREGFVEALKTFL